MVASSLSNFSLVGGFGGGVAGSQSSSKSSSFIPNYAEEPFLNSIAQYAGQVGQNVFNWAQGEYAKNSALTDANIHNYLNTSQSALNQAGGYQDTYHNLALPEANKIISEGNNYASPDRMLMDMGAAESGQQQAGDAARQNAERDLQSYGIDPSSGRYAALDRASQVSSAAAAVGAAQQARQFDITTGQNLQQQGLNALNNATSTFQGATTNAENTALQGFAGAENAGLANANTGVALQGAANPFLATASSLKYPPLGQQSTSQSVSVSPGSGGGGGGGKSPQENSPSNNGSGGSRGGGGGGSSGGSGPGSDSQVIEPTNFEGSGGSGDGSVFDTGSGVDYTNAGGNGTVTGGFGFDPSGSDGTLSADNAAGSGLENFSNSGMGFQDSFDNYGISGSGLDSSSSDLSGYAQGGAIPEDGGTVPTSASPSGGRMVDDVRAQGPKGPINVNADEFVIPRDVALWKGQEFFQKLIAQSRQARVTAPARPSHGAPQQGMR